MIAEECEEVTVGEELSMVADDIAGIKREIREEAERYIALMARLSKELEELEREQSKLKTLDPNSLLKDANIQEQQ